MNSGLSILLARAMALGNCWNFEASLACAVVDYFQEPLKRRAVGSLSKLPPLQRLEMLRRNA